MPAMGASACPTGLAAKLFDAASKGDRVVIITRGEILSEGEAILS